MKSEEEILDKLDGYASQTTNTDRDEIVRINRMEELQWVLDE